MYTHANVSKLARIAVKSSACCEVWLSTFLTFFNIMHRWFNMRHKTTPLVFCCCQQLVEINVPLSSYLWLNISSLAHT